MVERTRSLGSTFLPGKPAILTHGAQWHLTALAAARAAIAPDAWTEGNPNDLVVIGAASAHYSIARALSILGLGKKAFYPVAVDENEVLIIEDLPKVYAKALADGKRVMCVVANACATSTGLFDPLDAMGDFCQEQQLWFHVDGAHGAAALAGPKSKSLVKGIEKANSVIWDAHKMMRVPALPPQFFSGISPIKLPLFNKKDLIFHDTEVVGIDSTRLMQISFGNKLFGPLPEGEKKIAPIDQSFQLAKDFHALLAEKEYFLPNAEQYLVFPLR